MQHREQEGRREDRRLDVALVHLRHAGTGGTERYLNQLASFLAERGHRVTIVCRSREESPHPDVRFVVLHGIALGAGQRVLRFAHDVERHLRETRYDVVYGLGRTWTQDVLRLGGGCYRTFLECAHGATRTPGERALLKVGIGRRRLRINLAVEARALASGAAHAWIANSHMVKRDICERYELDAERVHVVPNAADLQRFHPDARATVGLACRRELGWSEHEFVVLFLGTGYARKGLAPLLDAFAARLNDRDDARLLVVGYDSDRARYERRASRLGIAARTVFVGGRRDAEAFYAAADLYVLPTLYDAFANSTVEALASGLPVVTTDKNGGAELLTQRVDGSVVSAPADVDALGDELAFWAEPGVAAGARAAARALAESRDVDSVHSTTLEILLDAAQAKRQGATA